MDQSELPGAVGGYPRVREQEFLGEADPEEVGEEVGESPVGDRTQRGERRNEDRGLGRDPPVGRQGQRESAAGRHPRKGDHDRLSHRQDLSDRGLLLSGELMEQLGKITADTVFLHRGHVSAGAERRSGPGE
ncbi:MAG: hypothetical protein ABSB90_04760 [Thermoplasmata archaeon]